MHDNDAVGSPAAPHTGGRTDGDHDYDHDRPTPTDTDADRPSDPDGEEEPMSERQRAHTVRLELVDRPGELLRALEPIAENGGNLLSIFHERGNITPRGHIPVEVDLECPPDRFDDIVDALREEGVNVIQAGAERYGEEVVVLLVGDLIGTDLSDTLERIEAHPTTAVRDVSLSAPADREDPASARLRMAAATGSLDDALATVRDVVAEKDLTLIEPADPEADV